MGSQRNRFWNRSDVAEGGNWWLLGSAILGLGCFWAGPNCTMPAAVAQQESGQATNASEEGLAAAHPYPRRVPAPGLEGGEWVNMAAPLSLADLRGRFVLLDFWTYCCINCMHVLPELKKLEHAFPNELVVIGVHSAKFEGEHVTDNIREAVLRYEIEHPVVNDAKMAIWQPLRCAKLADAGADRSGGRRGLGRERRTRVRRDQGGDRPRAAVLSSAGIVEAGAAADDSRATQTSRRRRCGFRAKCWPTRRAGGCSLRTATTIALSLRRWMASCSTSIGSGAIGRADGGFEACSFNHPQGMALVGEMLYVADTENHLLRKVDLTAQTRDDDCRHGRERQRVGDVFGERSRLANRGAVQSRARRRTTSLTSPWALWHHGNDLYIAMAGMHQIWKMPLDESTIEAYAGNGREDIVDGPLLAERAVRSALRVVCSAERAHFGRQAVVRGRQRREHGPLGAVRCERRGGNARGADGHAVRFRRRRWHGRDVRLQHRAGCRMGGWQAVRGRHVQQQDQGDRCRTADVPDFGRHWQGRQRGR